MDRIEKLPGEDTPSEEPPKRLPRHPSDAVHRNGEPQVVEARFKSDSATQIRLLDALHDHPDLVPIIREVAEQADAVLNYLRVGNRVHQPHPHFPVPRIREDGIPPVQFRQFPLVIGEARYDIARVMRPLPDSKNGVTTTKVRTAHGPHHLLVGTDDTVPFAEINHHRVLERDFPALQASLEVVRRDLDSYLSARKKPTVGTRLSDMADKLAWRFNPESSQLMIPR